MHTEMMHTEMKTQTKAPTTVLLSVAAAGVLALSACGLMTPLTRRAAASRTRR